MSIKNKLSVFLALFAVMIGCANQEMNVTQGVVLPQEQQTVIVQNQTKQPQKNKKQVRKQPSKRWKMSSRGKHVLKCVGIAVPVIVGTVALAVFGVHIWALWVGI